MIASQRGHLDVVPALKNWPVTMFIVVLQELVVYHLLDIMSFFDLVEYIGQENDYFDGADDFDENHEG